MENGSDGEGKFLTSRDSLIEETKTICDPVHGHITLHPIWVAVIDTPQFQRLRYIRQTGFCDYVFPGAIHDRFGHSIGVAYLAGCFLRHIRDRQPYLKITETEILCVELAGLCHDLGHGPFSHTWEELMEIEAANRSSNFVWKHENVSTNMLEYLIGENNLKPLLKRWGLGNDEIQAIKKMISGEIGENKDRVFLYQIVNHNKSGLDVDKWDYFLRDCHFCGVHCSFDYVRLLHFARVKEVENQQQICFRDKEAANVLDMFRTRSMLHHNVYQHRVVKLIHYIFLKAFNSSEKWLKIGPEQLKAKFWDWSVDAATICHTSDNSQMFNERMANFCLLTDFSIMSAVLHSKSRSGLLKESQWLLQSFRLNRDFKENYLWVGKVSIKNKISEEEISKCIISYLPECVKAMDLTSIPDILGGIDYKDAIIVQVVVIHWGKGVLNPLNFVYFYSKDRQIEAMPLNEMQSSLDLPRSFQEVEVRVYCKNLKKELFFKLICEAFKKYKLANEVQFRQQVNSIQLQI